MLAPSMVGSPLIAGAGAGVGVGVGAGAGGGVAVAGVGRAGQQYQQFTGVS